MAPGTRSRRRARRADGRRSTKSNTTATATPKPATTTHANANGSIGALPGELQNLIFSYLPPCARISLNATNHYYRRVVAVSHKDKVALLVSVERGTHYACTMCVRLLPLEGFGCTQTFKKRDHGGAEAAKRFCIRCGLERGIYPKGTSVRAYFAVTAVLDGVSFSAPYEPGSVTDWFMEYCRRRGVSLRRPPPPLPPHSYYYGFDDVPIMDVVWSPSG